MKINELIKELCPNGVEWKTLGEVAEIVRGASPRPISAFLTTAEDGIPWIKIGDVNPDSRYIENTEEKITLAGAQKSRLLHKGDFILSNSMSFGRPYILNIDGCIHDGWVSISNFGEKLISGYLFYILKSDVVQKYWRQKAGKGSVANLNADIIKSTKIPLPSIAIQTRIVEILDHFTNLTANLTAELNLRRKQFEHYREKLLSLDDVEGVEWKKLGEVFETRNGYTPSTNNQEFWDDGTIPWFKMEDIRENGRILSDSINHITAKAIKGKGLFKANSVILATSATIGEHALITVEHLSNQRFTNFYPQKEYIQKLDMKFVYYYFYIIDSWCKEHTVQGNFAGVNMTELYNCTITVPPLAIQTRIVSILDKFTALIENIEKELALRQKQYEYYREELLRFGS